MEQTPDTMFRATIHRKTPDQMQLAFALWTRRAVCELLEAEFALRIPFRTCGEYLTLVPRFTTG